MKAVRKAQLPRTEDQHGVPKTIGQERNLQACLSTKESNKQSLSVEKTKRADVRICFCLRVSPCPPSSPNTKELGFGLGPSLPLTFDPSDQTWSPKKMMTLCRQGKMTASQACQVQARPLHGGSGYVDVLGDMNADGYGLIFCFPSLRRTKGVPTREIRHAHMELHRISIRTGPFSRLCSFEMT